LVISLADFKGRRVLHRAGAPFVLVPYHGNSPTFKDGLGHRGAPFTAVTPTAPNAPSWQIPPNQWATNDNQYDPVANPGGAVMVERTPADLLEPARIDIWAKLHCANYQYVHRWVFQADGEIHAEAGLGGRLFHFNPATMGHIHNFYFRLDFDIAGAGNNLVQRFAHKGNNPGDDQWLDINFESKETADPSTLTKWRVLNKTPKPNGLNRSYDSFPDQTDCQMASIRRQALIPEVICGSFSTSRARRTARMWPSLLGHLSPMMHLRPNTPMGKPPTGRMSSSGIACAPIINPGSWVRKRSWCPTNFLASTWPQETGSTTRLRICIRLRHHRLKG
jgi:hypothetical protein